MRLTAGSGCAPQEPSSAGCGPGAAACDRLGFDLPDAFAGDLEDAADFFQRVAVAVAQAVAQADDLPLAVGERLEQLFDLARAAFRCLASVDRALGAVVLEELAEASCLRSRRPGGRG